MNTGEIAQAHGAKPLISHPAAKTACRTRIVTAEGTGIPLDRTDQAAKLHTDKRTDYDIVGDEDRP